MPSSRVVVDGSYFQAGQTTDVRWNVIDDGRWTRHSTDVQRPVGENIKFIDQRFFIRFVMIDVQPNEIHVFLDLDVVPLPVANFVIVIFTRPMNDVHFVDVVLQEGHNEIAFVQINEEIIIFVPAGGGEQEAALHSRFELKGNVEALAERKRFF